MRNEEQPKKALIENNKKRIEVLNKLQTAITRKNETNKYRKETLNRLQRAMVRRQKEKEAENIARRQKEAENKARKQMEARLQKEAENKARIQKEAENKARRQKEAENKARLQKEAENMAKRRAMKRTMTNAKLNVPKPKKIKRQMVSTIPKTKVIVSPRRPKSKVIMSPRTPKSVRDQRKKNVKLQIERMKRIRTRGQERKKFLNRLERGEDPYKVLMDAKKLNFNRAGGTM